jgi:hypothetical protein
LEERKMCFDNVYEMISNGDFENKMEYPKSSSYRDNHVFDENQTVKWNKEKVISENEKLKQRKMDYHNESYRLSNYFHECVVKAIIEDTKLQQDKAEIIFTKAYDDGHSEGYRNVVSEACDLCDFIYEVMK